MGSTVLHDNEVSITAANAQAFWITAMTSTAPNKQVFVSMRKIFHYMYHLSVEEG